MVHGGDEGGKCSAPMGRARARMYSSGKGGRLPGDGCGARGRARGRTTTIDEAGRGGIHIGMMRRDDGALPSSRARAPRRRASGAGGVVGGGARERGAGAGARAFAGGRQPGAAPSRRGQAGRVRLAARDHLRAGGPPRRREAGGGGAHAGRPGGAGGGLRPHGPHAAGGERARSLRARWRSTGSAQGAGAQLRRAGAGGRGERGRGPSAGSGAPLCRFPPGDARGRARRPRRRAPRRDRAGPRPGASSAPRSANRDPQSAGAERAGGKPDRSPRRARRDPRRRPERGPGGDPQAESRARRGGGDAVCPHPGPPPAGDGAHAKSGARRPPAGSELARRAR